MKKIVFILAFAVTTGVFAQPFKGKAYKTGNYIFCGKELPRQFAYLIEKKSLTDTSWQVVAKLNAPKNEAECKAAMLNLPIIIAENTTVDDAMVHKLWLRAQLTTVIDSLYAMAFDPRYQSALGCAWFDEGLTQNSNYTYRISKLTKNGEKTRIDEVTIAFPSNSYSGTLRAARFKIDEGFISISYEIVDTVNTSSMKVFRSRYKENKFTEVYPKIYFTRENNRIVGVVNDYSGLKDVTYSYLAVPFDVLGNMGKQTKDTLSVYNFTKASDLGIIERFDVNPIPEKKGNSLTWKIKSTLNLTSVDVYRSSSYDGRYKKIASMPPHATEYFDSQDLQPAIAYYYYLLFNNGYGNSLPSARIPAILKGSKLNFLPPQNFEINRNGRIVTLRFARLEKDTRSYYVYRANGYVAPLVQLPRMLLSSDSVLIYYDTLPLTAQPNVYSYAVASVNSSYNVSPTTERLSVSYSGGMLPVPSKVNAMMFNHIVFLTWDNVAKQNAAISSYSVYRSEVDANDKEIVSNKLIATIPYSENSYTDSTIAEGIHYVYRVQCVGTDASDVGSISMPTGVTIPEQLPLQPGSVSAYAAVNKIVISWDIPSDNTINKILIYRSLAGSEAELLKELLPSTSQYEDVLATPGKTYYYYIVTVNKVGKQSKPTDAVSGKIR
ncbi:MAG: hypothetical protein WCQ95_10515 [Bacteroidota bacterium]